MGQQQEVMRALEGLTLASKILKAMNGNISLKSISGKGSLFTLSFPLTLKPLIESGDKN